MTDGAPGPATWQDLVDQAPELAAAVRERFAVGKHATMATLRKDGGPRISGTEVEFSDGAVFVGSMPGALKARDLRRDPRVAIHSPTTDPGPDGTGWAGEAKLSGVAVEVSGPDDGAHRFRIDLTEVVHTGLGEPADHLLIRSWHPGRGVTEHRRH